MCHCVSSSKQWRREQKTELSQGVRHKIVAKGKLEQNSFLSANEEESSLMSLDCCAASGIGWHECVHGIVKSDEYKANLKH